jgi:hypothetical protein
MRVEEIRGLIAAFSAERLRCFDPTLQYLITSLKLFGKYDKNEAGEDDDEEDDDEEDDDDDEYDDDNAIDDASVEKFRSKMSSLFGGDSTTNQSASLDESSTIDDLIRFATKQQQPTDSISSSATTTTIVEESATDWALPLTDLDKIGPGTVLVANPSYFIKNFKMPTTTKSSNAKEDDDTKDDKKNTNLFANLFQNQRPKIDLGLLRKFGLTIPPPADLGPDRQADLLPVLLIVEQTTQPTPGVLKGAAIGSGRRTKAVLLNRRTGYLLGDLEQSQAQEASDDASTTSPSNSNSILVPLLQKFCIQPVWFGGVDTVVSDSNFATGLDMLHICTNISGTKLTEDGLYWGGNPQLAQNVVNDGIIEDDVTGATRRINGFDFKFFVQCTTLSDSEFQKYVNNNGELSSKISKDNDIDENILSSTCVFYTTQVAKDVLFKSRDRMGTRRAKPLWTEIMELIGGPYSKIKDHLYNDNIDETDDDDSLGGSGGGSFVWV